MCTSDFRACAPVGSPGHQQEPHDRVTAGCADVADCAHQVPRLDQQLHRFRARLSGNERRMHAPPEHHLTGCRGCAVLAMVVGAVLLRCSGVRLEGRVVLAVRVWQHVNIPEYSHICFCCVIDETDQINSKYLTRFGRFRENIQIKIGRLRRGFLA
jgi:hypothetical protein